MLDPSALNIIIVYLSASPPVSIPSSMRRISSTGTWPSMIYHLTWAKWQPASDSGTPRALRLVAKFGSSLMVILKPACSIR